MDFDPQRKGSFVSGSGRLCQISSKLVKKCDPSTDRHTHRQTHTDHTGDPIICPMLCYSNGTDNKRGTLLWPTMQLFLARHWIRTNHNYIVCKY